MKSTKVPLLAIAEFAWHHRLAEHATQEALERVGKYALGWSPHATQLDALFARCESPVERLFLLGWCMHVDLEDIEVLSDAPVGAQHSTGRWTMTILPQVRIETSVGLLRPDFAVRAVSKGIHSTIYVEIDGHEFHASTRQQVARDRQRERAIAEGGDVVLRFTGGEVDKDPGACAAQAVRAAQEMAKKRRRAA